MTIDDYIDLAIANQKFTSERELGRALGFKGNPVNHWRTKRAWPADPTMIRLAHLAAFQCDLEIAQSRVIRMGPAKGGAWCQGCHRRERVYSQARRAMA